MEIKNNGKKKIWFDEKKLKNIQDELSSQNWFFSATRVGALTYCLKNHVKSEWINSNTEIKSFCFWFPDILRQHLFKEEETFDSTTKKKCKSYHWLGNPFDDDNFCNAMFNLLREDKNNLASNCVLLLEKICLPDLNIQCSDFILISVWNGMELFFTNRCTHIPEPSIKFMDFLCANIKSVDNIKKYYDEFKPRENIDANNASVKYNFLISYLSIFLNYEFRYLFQCKKDGFEFVKSAMNLYKHMYNNFIKSNESYTDNKNAIDLFFDVFSRSFIKNIIYAYRNDKDTSIKYKHIIYLIYRFYLILQNNKQYLNMVLENFFSIGSIYQDIIKPYGKVYGKWDQFLFLGKTASKVVGNLILKKFGLISSEKSIWSLKNGEILNYNGLLPDELISKIREYNNRCKLQEQFDLNKQIVEYEKTVFYWHINEMIDFTVKIFKSISDEKQNIDNIDDISVSDFLGLLSEHKFNMFSYIYKIEKLYGGIAIWLINIGISEFEKFIKYHSVASEPLKLFSLEKDNVDFIDENVLPNTTMSFLYKRMIEKFIKVKTESDELAEIVLMLLEKFGSVYNFVCKVKSILNEKDYGYKIKGLWNLCLDCVLYEDKKNNKSIVSMIIKWLYGELEKYSKGNELKNGVGVDFLRIALCSITVSKFLDCDTNIFGQTRNTKDDTSEKTFILLSRIIEDTNFEELVGNLDVAFLNDFKDIKLCFEQIKNLKFEDLCYLTMEILNPNMKELEPFFKLIKQYINIRQENNNATVFDLIEQTNPLRQEKLGVKEMILKAERKIQKAKDFEKNRKKEMEEKTNLELEKGLTEPEKAKRKAKKLLNKLKQQTKKLSGKAHFANEHKTIVKTDLVNDILYDLYEVFCMAYNPAQHGDLNLQHGNNYIESMTENSETVASMSKYILKSIELLKEEKVFDQIEYREDIDTEIVEYIINLLSSTDYDKTVISFKNSDGINIIPGVIDNLKLFKQDLMNYKKQFKPLSTRELVNKMEKDYKGKKDTFFDLIRKKELLNKDKLLNKLKIKSNQFDNLKFENAQKATVSLVELNAFAKQLVILASSDNKLLIPKSVIGIYFLHLNDFLHDVYSIEPKSRSLYKEIILNLEMVSEMLRTTLDIIKLLNKKEIFNRIKEPENVDKAILTNIVNLLLEKKDDGFVFFTDNKGKDITSSIINELNVLRINLYVPYFETSNQLSQSGNNNNLSSEHVNELLAKLLEVLNNIYDLGEDDNSIDCDIKLELQLKMMEKISNCVMSPIVSLNASFSYFKPEEKFKNINTETIDSITELISKNQREHNRTFECKTMEEYFDSDKYKMSITQDDISLKNTEDKISKNLTSLKEIINSMKPKLEEKKSKEKSENNKSNQFNKSNNINIKQDDNYIKKIKSEFSNDNANAIDPNNIRKRTSSFNEVGFSFNKEIKNKRNSKTESNESGLLNNKKENQDNDIKNEVVFENINTKYIYMYNFVAIKNECKYLNGETNATIRKRCFNIFGNKIGDNENRIKNIIKGNNQSIEQLVYETKKNYRNIENVCYNLIINVEPSEENSFINNLKIRPKQLNTLEFKNIERATASLINSNIVVKQFIALVSNAAYNIGAINVNMYFQLLSKFVFNASYIKPESENLYKKTIWDLEIPSAMSKTVLDIIQFLNAENIFNQINRQKYIGKTVLINIVRVLPNESNNKFTFFTNNQEKNITLSIIIKLNLLKIELTTNGHVKYLNMQNILYKTQSLNELLVIFFKALGNIYDLSENTNLISNDKNMYVSPIDDNIKSEMIVRIPNFIISSISSLVNALLSCDNYSKKFKDTDNKIIAYVVPLISNNQLEQNILSEKKNTEGIIFKTPVLLKENILQYKKQEKRKLKGKNEKNKLNQFSKPNNINTEQTYSNIENNNIIAKNDSNNKNDLSTEKFDSIKGSFDSNNENLINKDNTAKGSSSFNLFEIGDKTLLGGDDDKIDDNKNESKNIIREDKQQFQGELLIEKNTTYEGIETNELNKIQSKENTKKEIITNNELLLTNSADEAKTDRNTGAENKNKNETNQTQNISFFVMIFMFPYRHKKLSISVMFISVLFSVVAYFFNLGLSIALGILFLTTITTFLMGKCVSKNIDQNVNDKIPPGMSSNLGKQHENNREENNKKENNQEAAPIPGTTVMIGKYDKMQ